MSNGQIMEDDPNIQWQLGYDQGRADCVEFATQHLAEIERLREALRPLAEVDDLDKAAVEVLLDTEDVVENARKALLSSKQATR